MKSKMTMVERFWSHVNKTDGCWLWTASKQFYGYGKFSISRSVWRGAHRVSYEWAYGSIPDGMFVCHRCDNPSCVRPDHLFLGSQRENLADMTSKGRRVFCKGFKGETNPNARLTVDDVKEIRRMHFVERKSGEAIARRFGISGTHARRIISGAMWSATEVG